MNALRGSVDVAEYKHVVLGLVFLKYISDAFEECRKFLGRNPTPTLKTPMSTGRKTPSGYLQKPAGNILRRRPGSLRSVGGENHACPRFDEIMLPLLNHIRDGREYHMREVIDSLAQHFGLTDKERRALLPSGQPIFENRIGWARTYPKKAGLLQSPKRGVIQITGAGKSVLAKNPPYIDVDYLMQFESFREFRSSSSHQASQLAETPDEEAMSPEEHLERAYQQCRQVLASEVLELVKRMPPDLFERLVVELLVKMGYGGSREEARKAIGRSGDEGIDGVINEARLGLDVVYIQARRWANTPVGRPEVQKEVRRGVAGPARPEGIFITTACFTLEAREYASRVDANVVLIDGETLAQLMIDYDVGVVPVADYQLKRIDYDFFNPE